MRGFNIFEVLKAEDVGIVATELLFFEEQPFYPIGSLLSSQVNCVWLGMGSKSKATASDIILEMGPSPEQPVGYNLFEIILRTGKGASYGGWVFGTDMVVLERFLFGHRVIQTSFRGEKLDFGFAPDVGKYKLNTGDLKGLSTGEIRELAKVRQRIPR